jgi:hypothetical protein
MISARQRRKPYYCAGRVAGLVLGPCPDGRQRPPDDRLHGRFFVRGADSPPRETDTPVGWGHLARRLR